MPTKTLLLMAVCAVSNPLFAHAAVVNGGFETGDLTGWTLVGSGQSTGSGIGVTPTAGSFQGYIETTGNFTALAPAVVASLGVGGIAIAGLGAGAPTNGTGLSQDVMVSAGDTLSFDWNFLTDELNEAATFNDFGFFTIDGSALLLASRNSSTYDTVLPPAGFDGQTDWATQTYTFTSAGLHKLGFGVFNVGDSGHNSVLLLDAVSIGVPEPSSIVMLGIGLSAALLRRWRKRTGG
jgi:PEP-CTERM motif